MQTDKHVFVTFQTLGYLSFIPFWIYWVLLSYDKYL